MSVDENLRYADVAQSQGMQVIWNLSNTGCRSGQSWTWSVPRPRTWHVGLLHRGRGATGGSRPGAGALRSGAQHHSQAAALRIAAQPIHASTLQKPGGLRRARRLSLRALGPPHLPDVSLVLADGPQPGDGPPGLLLVDRLPKLQPGLALGRADAADAQRGDPLREPEADHVVLLPLHHRLQPRPRFVLAPARLGRQRGQRRAELPDGAKLGRTGPSSDARPDCSRNPARPGAAPRRADE